MLFILSWRGVWIAFFILFIKGRHHGKGRTEREAVRPFQLLFLGVSADTGQGAALSLFQHRKQGPGKGAPRARGKFFIAFFSF